MLPPIVRFDRIDDSYDDSNKLKPKNPQTHPYFDGLSKIHAIHEGSDESAKITDSDEKDYKRFGNSSSSFDHLIKINLMNILDLMYRYD